jgi:ribosomal protein L32
MYLQSNNLLKLVHKRLKLPNMNAYTNIEEYRRRVQVFGNRVCTHAGTLLQ